MNATQPPTLPPLPENDWEQDTERIIVLPWWVNNPFVILCDPLDASKRRKVRIGDPVCRLLVANGWYEVER